ncbi:MAG: TIGR03435 family protein [Bryobacteraceae bacterium]
MYARFTKNRAIGLVGLLVTAALWAQSISFEVASIRLSKPGQEAIRNSLGRVQLSGSNITGSAMAVRDLIFQAYGIRPFQLAEAENWTTSDRWNILAKVAGDGLVTKEQVRPMFQALLADRFQLKLKRQMKEMPVYALRIADGGTKLRRPTESEALPPRRVARQDGVQQFGLGKATMEQVVTFLSLNVDRPIVDLTGLEGDFVYAIEFVPDRLLLASNAPAGVSIFKATESQLGLKLEGVRLPVEYFTIEHVERPSEN